MAERAEGRLDQDRNSDWVTTLDRRRASVRRIYINTIYAVRECGGGGEGERERANWTDAELRCAGPLLI